MTTAFLPNHVSMDKKPSLSLDHQSRSFRPFGPTTPSATATPAASNPTSMAQNGSFFPATLPTPASTSATSNGASQQQVPPHPQAPPQAPASLTSTGGGARLSDDPHSFYSVRISGFPASASMHELHLMVALSTDVVNIERSDASSCTVVFDRYDGALLCANALNNRDDLFASCNLTCQIISGLSKTSPPPIRPLTQSTVMTRQGSRFFGKTDQPPAASTVPGAIGPLGGGASGNAGATAGAGATSSASGQGQFDYDSFRSPTSPPYQQSLEDSLSESRGKKLIQDDDYALNDISRYVDASLLLDDSQSYRQQHQQYLHHQQQQQQPQQQHHHHHQQPAQGQSSNTSPGSRSQSVSIAPIGPASQQQSASASTTSVATSASESTSPRGQVPQQLSQPPSSAAQIAGSAVATSGVNGPTITPAAPPVVNEWEKRRPNLGLPTSHAQNQQQPAAVAGNTNGSTNNGPPTAASVVANGVNNSSNTSNASTTTNSNNNGSNGNRGFGSNDLVVPYNPTNSAANKQVIANGGRVMPPANPADQNPPCNTLYVGNLPADTQEQELKELFEKQPGYKRLCFRTKANGPMCFVEFATTQFASIALNDLYGVGLSNSVKGGIRLSYSKNPLGVRSNGGGPSNGTANGSSTSMNGGGASSAATSATVGGSTGTSNVDGRNGVNNNKFQPTKVRAGSASSTSRF